jgi:hypothetical protein
LAYLKIMWIGKCLHEEKINQRLDLLCAVTALYIYLFCAMSIFIFLLDYYEYVPSDVYCTCTVVV